MASSTIENYVKKIYVEQQHLGEGDVLVSMGRLAEAMDVTPGTATAMVKTLQDTSLVQYEPRGGVRLTSNGEKLALHVLRRHRLVELFLVKVLELNWSEVHEEAEAWEHVISEKVLQRMDELLGHPQVDPHGDPIPSGDGEIAVIRLRPLSDCRSGEDVVIARISDQEPDFLRFAEEHGLSPGEQVSLTDINAQADSFTLRFANGTDLHLGANAAGKILVRSRT